MGLARLRPRHAWLLPAAWLSAGVLAALIIGAMWGEWEDENVWRWVGVFSILLCAFTILVPVFGRMGRGDADPAARRVRFCPGCGKGLDADYGDIGCGACGARFSVLPRATLPDQTASSSSSSSSSSSGSSSRSASS